MKGTFMKAFEPTQKRGIAFFRLTVYILAALSVVLYAAFTRSAAFSDAFNSTVAACCRSIMGTLFALLPFSVAEMLLILSPCLVVALIVLAWKKYCASGRDALRFVSYVLTVPALVWILFVFLFAPGYYGSTLDEKLEIDTAPVSASQLFQTAQILREDLIELEKEICFLPDGASIMPYTYREMNEKLMDAYESFAAKSDTVHHFYSTAKPVMLSEPWSYTHITGVYTFFTGEANININFPDYTVPYTAAHELAHQRGIAREDEANFVAYLVCMESDDPYIRYSATLNLYEYVTAALYSASPALYSVAYDSLPLSIREEEAAYSRFFDKYREHVVAEVSETVNNTFLESQGTPGTQSYGMVVDLAVAYFADRHTME